MIGFEIAERTPEVIAAEINAIRQEVQGAVIDGTIEIGRRLCEAKVLVPAGSWGQWLRDNVSYSERTAQNAMAIYNEYGKKGVPAGLMNASITNALQLIGLPDDVKHSLIDSGEAESLSSRELKDRIKELEKERDEAQMKIEDLAGALQAEEDAAAAAEALTEQAQKQLSDMIGARDAALASKEALIEQAGRLRADITAAQKETEDLRKTAMDASQRAAQEAERRKELELELELRKAQEQQTAIPAVMEPVVVHEDTEETKREIERLRDRLRNQKSEAEIRFEDGYTDLVEQINYCVSLAEQINAERGKSAYAQCMRRLAGLLNNSAGQIARNC